MPPSGMCVPAESSGESSIRQCFSWVLPPATSSSPFDPHEEVRGLLIDIREDQIPPGLLLSHVAVIRSL
ncbi:hypothetical protein V6N13_072650 [Hibiscus sabdariffa]|uniref:Uncharacterized protein n=1 Tax=Hibiscus sabdariffa TaxID=183260 RepID=A0ABR2E6V0_9ROSI